jgi:glycerol-3-phosphate acyltransferase PlsX
LNGLVVKIHGNSKDKEVISAIKQCCSFVEKDVSGQIVRGLAEENSAGKE